MGWFRLNIGQLGFSFPIFPCLVTLIFVSQLLWACKKCPLLVYGLFLVLKQFFKWRILLLPRPGYQLFLLPKTSPKTAFLSTKMQILIVTILTSKILNHTVIGIDSCTLVARMELVSYISFHSSKFKYRNICLKLSRFLERLESNVVLFHFKNEQR